MPSPTLVPASDLRSLWRALGIAGGLAVVFIAVLLPKIAAGTLWHNDELLAANRAREMILRHDPLTVTINFKPDFKKPPLQYWLSAAFLRLSDNRELAIRLPALLYGAMCLPATVFLAWAASRRSKGNVWSLLLPAVAVAVFGSFVHFSRVGLLDTGSAFYLTMAFAGCLLARDNPRWWWLPGAFCFLGSWQKGPYAFAAWMLVVFLRRVREPELREIRSRHLWGAFGISLALASAWFAFQFIRHGDDLVLNAGQEQAGTLLRAHDTGTAGFQPYLYWWWLARDWALLGFLAPIAVAAATIAGWKRRAASALFELAAACAVFGLIIGLTPFRVQRYLIVIVPLLAVVTVNWVDGFLVERSFSNRFRRLAIAGIFASAIPVAAFHYFKPSKGAPADLLAITQELRDTLQPGEVVVIDREPEPDFNVPCFVLFYADLRQPTTELKIEAIKRLLSMANASGTQTVYRGIERTESLPRLLRVDPDLQILARQGEWVLWKRESFEVK